MARIGSLSPREISAVVERQMRNWEMMRMQRPAEPRERNGPVEDFIAISREVGAGGSDVAARLGARLGWPVFDRQILQAMAGDDEVRRQIYASMDERDIGWCEETLRSFLQREFVKNDYFHRLTETVLSIARQGRAVFLGRGADLVLPVEHGFRVRLVAPLQQRLARLANERGVSLPDAGEELRRRESERAAFLRKHFGARAEDSTRFDMTVNTARFSAQQCVELLLAGWAARSTREPRTSVRAD